MEALNSLCRIYWYPLYAYVRRRGHGPHDAQDLTQAYFERLLTKEYLAQVDRSKGKFRSFLLASLNHFLADEWDRSRRQKRGGGAAFLSLDATTAEERYHLEPVDDLDAERIFERRWALTLFGHVLARLEDEFIAAGKRDHFRQLQGFLVGDRGSGSCAQTGAALGMSEGAVRVAIHRMRQRYGELIREEIAHTVSSPVEIDDEIRHLCEIMSR
jgi:RNA polymerase sigma-70 factor (ECF subfamily)